MRSALTDLRFPRPCFATGAAASAVHTVVYGYDGVWVFGENNGQLGLALDARRVATPREVSLFKHSTPRQSKRRWPRLRPAHSLWPPPPAMLSRVS